MWERLIRWTTGLLVAAVGLGVLTLAAHWYWPVIRQNERMRKEILRLDREIRQEEETARQLTDVIRRLQEDPRAVERLARERLGLARPGETVIRFEVPTTNAAVPH
ncbi:MAG: septum formation initiator family protein [Verrucomicrobiota bacterium]|nr:septum formation initiator family protein [Limisphaera sp.]MDW8382022.1 septum formation initiator family protein [Verrucomicrobiota bacterium]